MTRTASDDGPVGNDSARRRRCALAAVLATTATLVAPVTPAPAAARIVEGKAISPNNERGQLGSGFGASAALTADGRTALIGGPTDGSASAPASLQSCSTDPETGANFCDYTPGLPNPGTGAVWVYQLRGRRWARRQKLTARDESGGASGFGSSVAISADGRIALVGGPADDGGAGAVWVFGRTAHGYVPIGAKLTAPAAASGTSAAFGAAVALSASGATAMIGAPGAGTKVGADGPGSAWVLTRARGAVFTMASAQQLAPIGESATSPSSFGASLSLSASGATALVGGPTDGDTSAGGVWIFARHGGRFGPSVAKLIPQDGGAGRRARFGTSVALSGTGATALIGGPGDGGGRGAAWLFGLARGHWHQQGRKLTGGGEAGGARFGAAVALSRSGALALVGGPNDANGPNNAIGPDDGSGTVQPGAAWLFVRAAGRYRQRGAKLTAPAAGDDGADGDSQAFGQSLALSANGATLLIGGPLEGFNQLSFPSTPYGAAWPFVLRGQP